MTHDIDNYNRGIISMYELCLIAFAEGYELKFQDDGVTAVQVH